MKKILFVYNADANIAAAIKDGLVKIFSPEKYDCALCQATYGIIFMKPEWKKFIESLPYEIEFFHRDEFKKRFNAQYELPAIFIHENNTLKVLVAASDIKSAGDLASLQNLIKNKLENSNNVLS